MSWNYIVMTHSYQSSGLAFIILWKEKYFSLRFLAFLLSLVASVKFQGTSGEYHHLAMTGIFQAL